jgi:hypothetical protein
MVYEYLPIKTTHQKVLKLEFQRYSSRHVPHLTLVVKSLEGVAVLRTSRLINSEATAILLPALKSTREDPMRIIADYLSINAVSLYDIFRILMTNDGNKGCKDLNSPSLTDPAIQNFLRVACAKDGLPQIHVALDIEGEIRYNFRVLYYIFDLRSILRDGFSNQVLCIVDQH